jgi:hypothetical protein
MNIELLELAAATLDDLLPELAFVGGATVELWITDPGAPPVRATNDVDVVVEVTTRGDFHAFEDRLRNHRFGPDLDDGIICRWLHRDNGLILDAMPSKPDILGFANHWQAAALPHAIDRKLPSGATIRAIPPPYLVATKLEAFKGRGNNDFLASRDIADIVVLLDGRKELTDEIADSDANLRHYLAGEFTSLLQQPRFKCVGCAWFRSRWNLGCGLRGSTCERTICRRPRELGSARRHRRTARHPHSFTAPDCSRWR